MPGRLASLMFCYRGMASDIEPLQQGAQRVKPNRTSPESFKDTQGHLPVGHSPILSSWTAGSNV